MTARNIEVAVFFCFRKAVYPKEGAKDWDLWRTYGLDPAMQISA
jgi:hypothetical protein